MRMVAPTKNPIKDVVIIAIFSALLTAGKIAIPLPNIEIVTLLIMLYASTFGIKIALPVTLIFCMVETILFGVHTWVIAYFIHWPTLAIVTYLVRQINLKKDFIYILVGGGCTLLFGVLTSAVDAIISSNIAEINFFVLFGAIYARGLLFYIVHFVSNIILIAVAFPVLKPLFNNAYKSYYQT